MSRRRQRVINQQRAALRFELLPMMYLIARADAKHAGPVLLLRSAPESPPVPKCYLPHNARAADTKSTHRADRSSLRLIVHRVYAARSRSNALRPLPVADKAQSRTRTLRTPREHCDHFAAALLPTAQTHRAKNAALLWAADDRYCATTTYTLACMSNPSLMTEPESFTLPTAPSSEVAPSS